MSLKKTGFEKVKTFMYKGFKFRSCRDIIPFSFGAGHDEIK